MCGIIPQLTEKFHILSYQANYYIVSDSFGCCSHNGLWYSKYIKHNEVNTSIFHIFVDCGINSASEAIEKLFSYGVLGQFFSSIIVICFTLFHLISPSMDEESDPLARYSYLTSCLAYLMCMLAEVSIYCIYGQGVLTESSDINQATYLSNWYVSNIHAKKDLIMLRERAKRPIILTAGGLFPLTLETLVKIFKTSYSFLAVLRQRN
uniref:Odorant receptor 42 n=1 Tax=Eucryptorrhynchus brandti TaxID=436910 RepID=A0A8F4MY86_EUCBR|nr:odorant receptor 42 [Eucryptorrhynchus brandti]